MIASIPAMEQPSVLAVSSFQLRELAAQTVRLSARVFWSTTIAIEATKFDAERSMPAAKGCEWRSPAKAIVTVSWGRKFQCFPMQWSFGVEAPQAIARLRQPELRPWHVPAGNPAARADLTV